MGSIRLLTLSSVVALLEVDDLLSKILLRLPPQPSSLPRAPLICKRWRSLVADPGFSRRFRLRHRYNPPLLGCFGRNYPFPITFKPTMEAPNRVPLPLRDTSSLFKRHSEVLGCRHGLVLLSETSQKQVLVWDPITADQHHITIPARFEKMEFHGAVLHTASDVEHFQVVLAVADDKDNQHRQVLACVYLSETGVWGDLVLAPLPPKAPTSYPGIAVSLARPAVLAEKSLYWILAGDLYGIVEFDLERKNIAVIQLPVDVSREGTHKYTVVWAECGGLGFLFMPDYIIQLWKRITHCGGVAFWKLDRTIEVDKLLPLNSCWEN